MPRYDVFLSHASADKPAVEHLAHKLRGEGIEPFLDKWHLIPGEPWQEALEEALDQSRTCAVFLGKTIGPWQNEEMRSALETRVRDAGFRVIPVLLPGGREPGKEELPRFLRRLTWVDFRNGLDDEDAFRRLLAGIKGKPPGPGSGGGGGGKPSLPYRCMAPAREPFVQRSEYAKVRDALLVEEIGRSTTVGITTAIHGAGGFGKTALAIELCYDEQVREKYPDGILWTTMGEETDAAGRLARVRDLIRWWTEEDPPAFETVSAASAHLRQGLAGKRALLVVDDVWRPEDVTPFHGYSPGATLLVTTRDSRTLPAESERIHVDAMEVPEAVRLLGLGLPNGTGVDLRKLAMQLGEWPLLLKIVNRQLLELIQREGLSLEQSLREVHEALEAEGLTVFDHEDLESRGKAVVKTVGASLRRISEEEVNRFEQLAIFPEDKDIPLSVLENLWESGSFATKKLCGRLHDLSLLLRFDRLASTIRLHDVIRAYLQKNGENQLAEWHRRLLDAYCPANGRWPDLPQHESYFWSYLFHHLIGAGQSDLCRGLLLDFQYLRSKLGATDVNALLADYSPFVESDEELRLVRDALRLSAHVLVRNPAELREQLWGRLSDQREAKICGLLLASKGSGIFWLKPRKASLFRPGGSLVRTIDHPAEPTVLAVFQDGRVISGSTDGMLRVWDIESGKILQVLQGDFTIARTVSVLDNRRVAFSSDEGILQVWNVESGQILQPLERNPAGISVVAALDSHLVLSGSYDGTLRVWDVEGGQDRQLLEGHSDAVTAVAVLDSRRVVSGSDDRTLRVWDIEKGQTLQILQGHFDQISAVAALDNCRVVFGSFDGVLQMWNVESGETFRFLGRHSNSVTAVAVLDSCRVVTASFDGSLRVWDTESGKTLQVVEESSDLISFVAALGSRRVISCSLLNGMLRVWDVDGGDTLQALERHSAGVTSVTVLDDHRVVSGSFDGTLRVWDVESCQTIQSLEWNSGSVTALAVLGSHRMVSGSDDGTLRVWDEVSGQILHFLEKHSNEVTALAVLDCSRLVSGSSDGTLRVWDVGDGRTLRVLTHTDDGIRALAVLDSRRVIASSDDRRLRVWDVESGETLQVLEGHSKSVNAVAALDSLRVISGSGDQRLRVWDVESGETIKILEGHTNWVEVVETLDSNRVVSGSDQTLRVWDVESGRIECQFTLDASVTAVSVISERRIIVVGDDSGRVHFFDFVEPENRP